VLVALAVALVVVVMTAGVIAGLVYFTQTQNQNTSTNPNGSNGSHGSSGSNGSGGSSGSGGSVGTGATGGSGGSGSTNPPTNNPIRYKLWTDPKEGAFSVQTPDGWSTSPNSGVARPYFGADFYFNATNSKGTISVFFAKNAYPDFVEPLPPTSFNCSVSSGIGYTDPVDSHLHISVILCLRLALRQRPGLCEVVLPLRYAKAPS
jgi:hypothetical protein